MKDLTNEQLCKLAQAGDEQAVSLLIKANLPFVRKVANQIVENPVWQEHLSSCGVGFDDLVQAGSIGLWRAIDSYDLSSGVKFLTYAAPAIIAIIKKANNNQTRRTNGSSPEEKHKRGLSGWHPGGGPNCGFSSSAGWLSSWTTFSQ